MNSKRLLVELTRHGSLYARGLHRGVLRPLGFWYRRLRLRDCGTESRPTFWLRSACLRALRTLRLQCRLYTRQRSIRHLLRACDLSDPARSRRSADRKRRLGTEIGERSVCFLGRGWIRHAHWLTACCLCKNSQVLRLAGTPRAVCI